MSAITNTGPWTNGAKPCSSRPGVVVDGELVTTNLVDINLGIRILLGSSYYEDWAASGETFVTHDPLGNPVDKRHPWNQTTIPKTAEARLQRQLHLGHVAALVRQAHERPSGARYRRRPHCPALDHRARQPGGHRLRQSHGQQRQNPPAENRDEAGSRIRMEDSEMEQCYRTRPRAVLFPGLCRGGRSLLLSSRP